MESFISPKNKTKQKQKQYLQNKNEMSQLWLI